MANTNLADSDPLAAALNCRGKAAKRTGEQRTCSGAAKIFEKFATVGHLST
jgi:hypothetical protein